jgi:hypothetical protein
VFREKRQRRRRPWESPVRPLHVELRRRCKLPRNEAELKVNIMKCVWVCEVVSCNIVLD